MTFLRNAWYFAAWQENIDQGELFARTILSRPLVFFRDQNNKIRAMDDRCPHRSAPLSMGRLSDGCISCCYHGLKFNADGECVENPHPSGKIPAAAKVRTYPIIEKHSGVWIWMGEKQADPSLIPDYSIMDEGSTKYNVARRDHLIMQASYELIIDNLLDCSHTSFVHEGILGTIDMIDAPTEIEQNGTTLNVIRYARDVEPPSMFDMIYRQDGKNADVWTDFRWDVPSNLLLDVGITAPGRPKEEGTGYYGIHIITPETETTTHYHTAASRWNIQPGSEAPEMKVKIADLRQFAFQEQDEPLIRAQQKILSMFPSDEIKPVMLETDLGVVRWRRIVEKLIAEENAPAESEAVAAQ